MNERIRELARQAGATVDKGTHPLTGVVDGLFMGPNEVEKFAQLMVKECISTLEEKIHRSIDNEGDEIWADLILKEHFGVEQ